MRPLHHIALLALASVALSSVLTACSADMTDATYLESQDAAFDTSADAGVGSDGGGAGGATPCRSYSPGEDTDGDGLADAIEDADLDCVVDEDETDPEEADTDGDGLLDGEEDIDGDGRWDQERGEFDPTNPDTDGDGVLDGDESLAAVCTGALFGEVDASSMADGERFAHLGSGWTVSVVPDGMNAVAIYDEGAMAVLASAMASRVSFRGVIAAVNNSLAAIDAVVSEVDATGSRVVFDVQLPGPLPPDAVLGSVVGNWSFGAPIVSTWESDRYVLVVAADEAGDSRRFLAALALPEEAELVRRLSIDNIANDRAARARPYCEEIAEAAVPNELRIVVAADSTQAASEVREAVGEEVAALVERRQANGLRSEVWVVRGDAHVAMAMGSPEPAAALRNAQQVRDAMRGWGDASADQRLLANAVALLDADYGSAVETLVVFVGAREDAEFRDGTFMGRDGDPLGAPLASGENRLQRSAHYTEQLAARDVAVVAVAPGVYRGAGGSCPSFASARPGLEPDAGLALRDVAMALDGVFVDVCGAPRASTVREGMERVGAKWSDVFLTHPPIPGTLRVSGASPVWYGTGDGRRGSLSGGDGTLGSGYLFWE